MDILYLIIVSVSVFIFFCNKGSVYSSYWGLKCALKDQIKSRQLTHHMCPADHLCSEFIATYHFHWKVEVQTRQALNVFIMWIKIHVNVHSNPKVEIAPLHLYFFYCC